MMQLEMPEECECLLCGEETTELKENKSGNPYFQCTTFNSIVNLRPDDGDETAETVLSESIEAVGGGTLEEPEEEAEAGDGDEDADVEQNDGAEGQTLNDLLSQGDDDA